MLGFDVVEMERVAVEERSPATLAGVLKVTDQEIEKKKKKTIG